jgi:type II secretory pathway pseudopilin PulG
MCRRRRNGGLTLVEVLILIGIGGCLVIMLLPAIQSARESSRRTACMNNMKQLGFALLNYEQAQKRLPPSSGVTRNAEGAIIAVDGWSWIVATLPYWKQSADDRRGDPVAKGLYKSLDIAGGRPLVEPAGAKGTAHADALATSLPVLLCPSFGGSPYADPATRTEAITNYKGMGATHIESLSVASPHPLTPKHTADQLARALPTYNSPPLHPDGVLFPGDGLSLAMLKYPSLTILAVESIEPRFSRWTVGAEAAVVGLPPNVEFEKDVRGCVPKGYRKAWDKSPEAFSTYWTYHTYLDWDYDASPYDGMDGTQGGRYGPSSNHPGVVNHLFADCSIYSISRSIDVTVYMSLITHSQVAPSLW